MFSIFQFRKITLVVIDLVSGCTIVGCVIGSIKGGRAGAKKGGAAGGRIGRKVGESLGRGREVEVTFRYTGQMIQ